MPAKYLLDSTVIIDHLNGMAEATKWIARLRPDDAAISVVTRAEVLSKAANKWEEVAYFLDEFACFSIGPDEADKAAGLRSRFRVKLPDAFQAAVAQSEELILVTRDEADFKKIEDLKVLLPYKL